MDEDILRKLEERLGPLHARQRLGIETDHEALIFGQGLLSFHIVNWYPVHSVIRNALKLTGLYWRGRRNTGSILVKRNDVMFKELPPLFDGFTILHLSDMHVDMNEAAMQRLIELVGDIRYDLCVLTGDYRGKNFGPFEATLNGVARVRAHLKEPVYGVLGDHDTIQMVPEPESMMPTASRPTISKRLRCRYRMASSPSYCHTHRRSIVRRLMPILICC